jgi:sugar lactone lactonase YvrE
MKKTIFANVFESGVYASRLAAVAVIGVLAGCGTGVNGSFQSGVDNTPAQGAALHGTVHGGQQPVSGANIQLWAVGNSGYGSTAVNLLTTSVTTQNDGTFTITGDYTCPSTATPVYITAQGGNPGNGNGDPNSQIMLAAALGTCPASGTLSSSLSIQINEVTTAATAFALGQYFTTTFGGSSTDSFGAPNTTQAQAGIANAFATVNNLANISTGAAVTSQTFSATTGTVSGDVVTVTPEYQKLNLIADILAACVNSDPLNDNTNCNTLFTDVTPTGGTTPTDTLQAAVDMSLNPTSTNTGTSSIAALFALQTAQSPFVASALSAAPGDWTLGINYFGSTGPLTSKPVGIAIDASGNIWVVNNAGGATNNITEFSASSLCSSGSAFNCSGVPLYTSIMQVTTPSVNITSINPRNIAIDTYGNVFVPTSSGSGYMFEYNLANGNSAIALAKSSYGVAIDGNNDLFVGEQSSTATISFYEFNANSSSTASILATTDEVQYGNETGIVRPEYMAVDTSGNVWASSGVGTSGVQEMTGISTSGCTYPCTTPTVTYNTVTGGSLSTPFGLAAGPSGGMWIANSGNSTVSYLTNATTGPPYGSSTWFNAPESVAVDGAGIAWVANHSTASVSELTSSGTLLSPTSATNTPGFQHSAGISGAQSIAVDPSGNVWVANNSTTAGIEEIVGVAAPTVTPIALALKNGTVGQKP